MTYSIARHLRRINYFNVFIPFRQMEYFSNVHWLNLPYKFIVTLMCTHILIIDHHIAIKVLANYQLYSLLAPDSLSSTT